MVDRKAARLPDGCVSTTDEILRRRAAGDLAEKQFPSSQQLAIRMDVSGENPPKKTRVRLGFLDVRALPRDLSLSRNNFGFSHPTQLSFSGASSWIQSGPQHLQDAKSVASWNILSVGFKPFFAHFFAHFLHAFPPGFEGH